MTKMYEQRRGNISAFRGCGYSCTYCAFKRLVMLNKNCPQCATFEPHFHPEALDKTPPKTKEGEFLTIGLSSDISFASHDDLVRISSYCAGWGDRTFLIQSKNPAVFLEHYWPENVILGTTIETNYALMVRPLSGRTIAYNEISQAPYPDGRHVAMCKLNARKIVTIEPVMSFQPDVFFRWLGNGIKPERVYIGYDSGNHRLPEPPLEKVQAFIFRLQKAGVDVKTKLLRKAWWEA